MNRRYSSVNGPAQTPSGQAASSINGRYSLVGRASIGAAKASRNLNANPSQVANDLAGMSISAASQPMSSQASQQPRQSLAPRQSLDARNSLTRRSSVYGKTSLTNLNGSQPAYGKDPRPIRDKTFQANCTRNLVEFLMRVGYPHPISQKLLTAPSAKDFQQIFKFLYSNLDPTFEFGKKFEEEVPGLLKGLRYPFANEISKSQLYAVGSMHAWPGLLAMLNWMVELIQCCDELNNSLNNQADDMMVIDAQVGQTDPSGGEKIFFDYLCKTYKVFLAGSDNFDAMISELGANFEKRNEHTLAEAADLSQQVDSLDTEYQKLTKEEPPLAKAQREKGIYLSDIEKFKKFISHLTVKKQKFIESIERFEEDVGLIEKELGEFELQRAALQAQVDAQDICPEDIDRMNADKDQLIRTLESLNQSKEETSKIFWDRELQVQKRLDNVEKLVQEYNYICERIALVPSDAANANGYSFELVFNPHAAKMDGLLNVDMKTEIQPILLSMREEYHATIHQAQDKLLSLQEALDRLSEAVTDKQEEVSQIEEKIKRTVQSYLNEKEAYQNENKQNGQESDNLEATIQKLRSDNSANLLHSQQRLQRVTIEYDQLVSRVAEEKERIGNEIFRVLEELINFKTTIETTLGDLEQAYSKELPK